MSNQMTAYNASTSTTRDTPLRITGLFALNGGAAWVIDTVTIAVVTRSFDTRDSVLFFTGLGFSVLSLVALAVHLSAGRSGPARVAHAVGAFLATAGGLSAIAFAADTVARRLFSPANTGLHDEWSCFSIGLGLLAISGWAYGRTRRR